MPDALDDEIYPHNDVTVLARPVLFRAEPTTGEDENIRLSGRTDGTVFLSLTENIHTATAIHAALQAPLTEVGATGTYAGVIDGSALATHLLATLDGATLFRHWQFGSDVRRVVSVIYRRVRP